MPVDCGFAAAPVLGDGIADAPLADCPGAVLAGGADGAPLAENGLGFTAGAIGVTVGRMTARPAKKLSCAAVARLGPRLLPGRVTGGPTIICPHHHMLQM